MAYDPRMCITGGLDWKQVADPLINVPWTTYSAEGLGTHAWESTVDNQDHDMCRFLFLRSMQKFSKSMVFVVAGTRCLCWGVWSFQMGFNGL